MVTYDLKNPNPLIPTKGLHRPFIQELITYKRLSVLLIYSFFVGMTSCQKENLYNQTEVFKSAVWRANQVVSFTDTLTNISTPTVHLELTLRHTNKYAYQNIWLFILTETANTKSKDSINWTMVASDGKWLGNGWGSLYTLTFPLHDLHFSITDTAQWFHLSIYQALNDSLLTGISDLGLRVYQDQ
jgi:gliding motility-associated lipoprotein GldH